MGPPDPNVGYEVVEVDDADWLRERFRPEAEGKDIVIRGKCRRCDHDVDKRLIGDQVLSFRRGDVSAPRAMRCNCGAEHPPREGGQGCGAFWGLSLKPRT